MTTINTGHLFTAACLWEAALDAVNQTHHTPGGFTEQLALYKRANGTAMLREEVAGLALACDDAWSALTPDQQDDAGSFDWDFCPDWLADNFFKLTA